jgi:hypothetical protein
MVGEVKATYEGEEKSELESIYPFPSGRKRDSYRRIAIA